MKTVQTDAEIAAANKLALAEEKAAEKAEAKRIADEEKARDKARKAEQAAKDKENNERVKAEEKARKAAEAEEAKAAKLAEKEAAKAAKKAEREAKKAEKNQPKDCACGCGTQTKSRFAPGHDATFYSNIKRVVEGTITIDSIPEGARRDAVQAAINAEEYGHGPMVPRWNALKGETPKVTPRADAETLRKRIAQAEQTLVTLRLELKAAEG